MLASTTVIFGIIERAVHAFYRCFICVIKEMKKSGAYMEAQGGWGMHNLGSPPPKTIVAYDWGTGYMLFRNMKMYYGFLFGGKKNTEDHIEQNEKQIDAIHWLDRAHLSRELRHSSPLTQTSESNTTLIPHPSHVRWLPTPLKGRLWTDYDSCPIWEARRGT